MKLDPHNINTFSQKKTWLQDLHMMAILFVGHEYAAHVSAFTQNHCMDFLTLELYLKYKILII